MILKIKINERKYQQNLIKTRIKNRINEFLQNKNSESMNNFIMQSVNNSFSNKIIDKRYHAYIYFQNVGKNSFINVILNNRLIYNKTLGKLKINNVKIKKKEKSVTRNLFSLGLEFTEQFFENMIYKNNIKTISISYNSKLETIYPFKKHFNYRIIGNYLKRAYTYNGVIYSLRQYKRKEHLFVLYSNNHLYNPYEEKMKKWIFINFRRLLKHLFILRNSIKLTHISMINKYPYNGCKKKKMKKI